MPSVRIHQSDHAKMATSTLCGGRSSMSMLIARASTAGMAARRASIDAYFGSIAMTEPARAA